VLLDLGRTEAAASWYARAREHRQPRDVEGAVLLLAATARHEGDPAPAQEAAQLAEETDALNLRASVHVTLAELLTRDGDHVAAERALAAAHALYRQKENAAAAARLEGRAAPAAS
jgi:hypothetical protein